MEELKYAVSLDNAAAIAAMHRFLAAADEMTQRMEHMSRSADGAAGGGDRMRAKMDGLHTSTLGAAKATESLFDKIAHLGSNVANIVAGFQALGKAIEYLKGPQTLAEIQGSAAGAARSVGRLGGVFGIAAVGAAGFAAALAVALPVVAAIGVAIKGLEQFKTGLKLAAQFEQTSIAFKTLTGDAEKAKQVLDGLSKMAIDTPFQEGQLQGAAKSMLAARVPAEQLKGELTAMGNIASATGADIERLSVVYAQVAGKGKLYAEELQQFVEQGAGELRQAVAQTLGVTTSELSDMLQKGQVGFSDLQRAIQTLAGEGGKWGTAMAEQSRTTLGLLSSLQDSVGKVLRLLAQPVNDGPIKAFLTTAVDVATQASGVIEQAMKQNKAGEALENALRLGAKLGINALLDFFSSIPQRIQPVLQRIGKAIAAALTGSFDQVKKLLASFDGTKLRFDTSSEKEFFAGLMSGAKAAEEATKRIGTQTGAGAPPEAKTGAADWAKQLDAKAEAQEKKDKLSTDERRNRLQEMAAQRNDIMGQIAMLKAMSTGNQAKADSIDRAQRVQRYTQDALKAGASKEEAERLGRQRADLEDRMNGKPGHISGVKSGRKMGGDLGPLSLSTPLAGGGLDEFNRLQKKRELKTGEKAPPGYAKGFGGGMVPVFSNGLSDRPARRVSEALESGSRKSRGPDQDTTGLSPELAALHEIRGELQRIRTA